jgi:protein SCO1/2
MMNRKTSLLAVAISIVAVIAGMLLSRALVNRAEDSHATALVTGTLLDPPRPLPSFSLVDQANRAFDNERLRGRWSYLFFGFTNCPDVCPTTLRMLAQTEQSLSDLPPAQRPQVILVSVDPKRDTPQQLVSYLKFFSPAFIGLTGEQATLDAFTRQLGVPVAITPTDNGNYTVDHSAAIFLIDPNGAMRALFSPPHSPTSIADDYRRILNSAAH